MGLLERLHPDRVRRPEPEALVEPTEPSPVPPFEPEWVRRSRLPLHHPDVQRAKDLTEA